MPSKLTELISLCEKLTSGKALERKKAADRLKGLLSTSDVLRQLDRNAELVQDGFGFTWGSMFEAVDAALLHELKGQRSAANAAVKKPEMYSLMKSVLQHSKGRTTQDGKCVIKPEVIFEHCSVILSDYPHVLASEYAFILVNYFLTPTLWIHWSKPDLSLLSKILIRFVKGLAKGERGFNVGPISQAIEKITQFMSQRIDIRPMKFLAQFKEFFLNTKESNSQTLKSMLSAVNTLREAGAVNNRLHLAQFGRDIALQLLQTWKDNCKVPLKLEIVRFFILQIVLSPSDDDSSWQDTLWKLYEILYQEVGSTKTTLKLAGDRLPPLWTEEFISLLAQVCLLLLPDGQRLSEVSQQATQSQYSAAKPAKRRRIQSGWESLKFNLLDSSDYQSQIAWIRVIRVIVGMSDEVPLELSDILEAMVKLLSSTKKSVVLTELHHCLLSLASQARLHSPGTERLWRKVIALSISLVERSQPQFYVLLSYLMKSGRLQDKGQLICLIKRCVTSPLSREGICWLSSYLSIHQLGLCPLLTQTELELASTAPNSQPLHRLQLWQHMWVSNHLLQSVNYEEGVCRVIEASEAVTPAAFATILAALVCKEPIELSSTPGTTAVSRLDTVKAMYDSMLFVPETLPPTPDANRPCTILHSVADHVDSILLDRLTLSTQLIGQMENTVDYVEDSLWLMEMLITYLATIRATAEDHPLFLSTKALWTELVARLVDLFQRSGSERSYLPRLLAVVSTKADVLAADVLSLKNLTFALIADVHTMLECPSSNHSSHSSRQSSDSASDSVFTDFAIPEVPEPVHSSDINGSCSSLSLTQTAADLPLLHSLQTLVHVCSLFHESRRDVIALLSKLASVHFRSHSQIALETFNTAAGHWTDADHGTVLTLLFHSRGLVESYHSDPHLGVACLRLISTLTSRIDLSKAMAAGQQEDLGAKIYSIVNGLILQLYERRDERDGSYQLFPLFGVEYRLALVESLTRIIKADHNGRWRLCAGGQGAVSLDCTESLIKALLDRDYTVRRFTVQSIDVLFNNHVHGEERHMSSKEQEKIFDSIYTEIRSILAVSGNMSDLDKLDEERTRTATLLSLFQKIILSSPACSRKSLCALMLCLDEENRHIDSALIGRVLERAVPLSPYVSVAEMCLLNLGYVAKEWINMEFKLRAFPTDIFGQSDITAFFKKHVSTFAPLAFDSTASWSELLDILGAEEHTLLSSQIHSLMLHILPPLANGLAGSQHAKELFEKCAGTLASVHVKMASLLRDKLMDILLLIYTSMWDYSAQHSSEPEPDPPHYTKVQVQATITYLLRILEKKAVAGSTLLGILSTDPAQVTSLHFKLALHMSSGKHVHELRQRVDAYLQFISDLLPELESSLLPYQLFLSESVVAVIINAISWLLELSKTDMEGHDEPLYIWQATCQLINCCGSLFNLLVLDQNQTLLKLVPRMTYGLVSLSNCADAGVTKAAADLLTDIWTTHGDCFTELVDKMEPLPENIRSLQPQLSSSNFLHQLIAVYTKTSHGKSHDRSHLLSQINCQLGSVDTETLTRLLAGKGDNVIGQLAHSLLQHVKSCTPSERTGILACLTKLGPSFVSKTCRQRSQQGQDMAVDAKISSLVAECGDEHGQRDYIIISHILHYLLYSRPDVMCVCDSVLANIFGSKTAGGFLKSLSRTPDGTEHLLALVAPYTASRQVRSNPPQTSPSFLSAELWGRYRTESYDHWIRNLTCAVSLSCKAELLRHLHPLCSAETEFCELVLPYLIHNLLEKGDHGLQANLSNLIKQILLDATSRKAKEDASTISQRVVATLLNIIQYLRTKSNKLYYPERVKVHTAWHDNFWLDVDYALLAQSALYVSNYAMAAMFAEIRIYQSRGAPAGLLPAFNAQSLMIQVYSALNEMDMLCGWGVSKLTDTSSRLAHYNHEMNWSRALAVKDSMLSHDLDDPLSHSFESLQSSGLTQLLDTFLQNIHTDSAEQRTLEMRYHQAWTNMQWDSLPTPTRLRPQVGFNECLFMATKSLTSDLSAVKPLLDHTTGMCEKSLLEPGHVSSCQVGESLARLQLVKVLREVATARIDSSTRLTDETVARWRVEAPRQELFVDSLSQSEIRNEEAKLVLSSLLEKGRLLQSGSLRSYLVESVVALSVKARQSWQHSMSESIMSRFKQLHASLWNTECDLELAMIYWDFEESERAMYVMKRTMCSLQTALDKSKHESRELLYRDYCLSSKAFRTYGSWLGTTKLEGPETITDKYLIPAVQMAEKSKDKHEMEEAYYTVAEFADNEYERLGAYMKSPEFQHKLDLHKIQLEQIEDIHKHPEKRISLRYQRNLEQNMGSNEKEVDTTRNGFVDNMHRAVLNHINTMKYGGRHDMFSVFRLVAIWFDNEDREDIRGIVRDKVLGKIATYKFIPLMCQLTARLSNEPSDLQTSLTSLILQTGKEHPHHVLPILFALKCAATDLAKGSAPVTETMSRATAARNILKMIGAERMQLIKDYSVLTDALIQLANIRVDGRLNPASCKLAALSSLRHTHVYTHQLEPRASCDYGDVPHVYKYDKHCENAGGVNEPKIIMCVGSDGKKYKQLCKGKDDTRQDAVMQQVFALVNELLSADQSARSLKMRTYKVIPLSQRSGVLEWCVGTIPVGKWLGATTKDKDGAHAKYHPEGWSVTKCREKMKSFKSSWTDDQYFAGYNEVCRNLPPVMRHFFMEKFRDPELWLEARQNYCQSVAVTSIVGYILGIGDRHTNNMLLDTKTGELIQIDFGVAFDQGRALTIPETIPFRLSRDIVDPLGPTGVDGAFRRCCEKTLHVLRRSERAINTILQVLIDDPLLDWTLSPEKLEQKQKNQARPSISSNESNMSLANESMIGTQLTAGAGDVTLCSRTAQDTNKHQQAASALLRVQHKLRGYEQNSQLSVNGQVNYLIQQATDPYNLAKLFHGWQPYL